MVPVVIAFMRGIVTVGAVAFAVKGKADPLCIWLVTSYKDSLKFFFLSVTETSKFLPVYKVKPRILSQNKITMINLIFF